MILSLVRANNGGSIGFVREFRRVNVAITRAKTTCVLIGHADTLGRSDSRHAKSGSVHKSDGETGGRHMTGTIAELVADARQRGLVISASQALDNF